MLTVSHLHKRFGHIEAVKDVSFHVHQGEIYGLLGPNGAGKTTIIRMLAGTMRADKGQIRIGTYRLDTHPHEARARMGVVFSDVGLQDRLTALENVALSGVLYGLSPKEAYRRAEELLTMLGMKELQHRQVGKFSKGERQRVHMARALVHSPQVLLLDEPSNGLDIPSTLGFERLILRLKEEGTTILLCTHIMSQAEKLCDRVGILYGGQIILEDTMQGIREKGACRAHATLEEAMIMLMNGGAMQ